MAKSESEELFTEDQAVSPSYDLAPLPLLFCQKDVSISYYSYVSPAELTDGRGAKSCDGEKA